MSKKGVLCVMSGFSGAGKGTIVGELLKKSDYQLSISCTTRKPREGEQNGREYFFVSRDEFEKMIASGDMIEYAEYAGNYYGTPKKAVNDWLMEGKEVILEIEVQGGMQVRKLFPDAVLIFVVPPSATELHNRLKNRGTENDDQIRLRLEQTTREVSYIKDYDYMIINENLDDAVEQIDGIINNQKSKPAFAEDTINKLKQELSELSGEHNE
ncbi:MAG: guanylate kinase [Eubacterium sp.]|nr:guanylate kinase [Eubacterium sp.]